mmetsp:Transcript_10339/g.27544  ORF Transcript_10339/g.27544 Transcript_10339/m.27544 type:complete len:106 (+) Transcript_10339:397-714(+)
MLAFLLIARRARPAGTSAHTLASLQHRMARRTRNLFDLQFRTFSTCTSRSCQTTSVDPVESQVLNPIELQLQLFSSLSYKSCRAAASTVFELELQIMSSCRLEST